MSRFPKGKGNAEAVRHASDMRNKKTKGRNGARNDCSVMPFVLLFGAALATMDSIV